MTADGSDDHKIGLQGAPEDWTWSVEDAKRDSVTGEFPTVDPVETNAGHESDESDNEAEDLSEGEEVQDFVDSEDSDADTDDGEEPGEYKPEAGWKVVAQY